MARKGSILSIYVESSSTIDSQYRFDELKRSQANDGLLLRPKGGTTIRGYNYQIVIYLFLKRRWTRRIRLSFPRLFHRENKEQKVEKMRIKPRLTISGENENKATSNFCKKLKCFLKDVACSIWKFGRK
ncbi:uncharacterized protein LOC107841220 [Capsicum annuum]|uniref:uncharacterized protein LOC107841220 n=1 Tax=Capsicum annuum TaxID=4072 RepID=UPI001FB0AA24|nr:uncharacterized protein LOC107841220 [Capsicum annuum]